MIKLSEKQKQIVEFEEGALLVKAGPGSGKTRVLIERIKRLLKRKKRIKILALTFSNMAAEEMKSRIEEDAEISDLIDNVTIGTIHAFCLDLLQNKGYMIGLSDSLVLFESLDDRKKILEDAIIKNSKLKAIYLQKQDSNKFLSDCLSFISDYKKKFIVSDSYDTGINYEIYRAYNEQLLLQGAIDFDDILFYAYRILTENTNVAHFLTTQYKYICVDEAQDLNYSQYSVIRALCGESFKNIMMVGDENQSIYRFNGSNSKLMAVEFVRDFSPTVFELNENFRCAKSIVEFANTLEQSNDYPNCFYNGELKLNVYSSEQEEAEAILKRIRELISEGHPDIESKLSFDNFAVIARNKYVFSSLEQLLQKEEVPYYFKKTTSGIESESLLFQFVDLKLRVIANSRDIIHKEQLKRIEETETDFDFAEMSKILSKIDAEQFELKNAFRSIEAYLKNMTASDEEKYLAMCDLNLWKQHWSKYCAQVPSENRTLMSFRNYVALGKTQISENSNGITLLTAHMSKGLQYEVVFVIGLSEGTFPDYRAVKEGGESLLQEKNNMYVAVTRAKRLCYLSYSKWKKMPWGDTKYQNASQFLSAIADK